MHAAILWTVLFVAVFGATFSAYCYGLRRGRDIGWSEFYFENVRRDRARRNALGQFREKA